MHADVKRWHWEAEVKRIMPVSGSDKPGKY